MHLVASLCSAESQMQQRPPFSELRCRCFSAPIQDLPASFATKNWKTVGGKRVRVFLCAIVKHRGRNSAGVFCSQLERSRLVLLNSSFFDLPPSAGDSVVIGWNLCDGVDVGRDERCQLAVIGQMHNSQPHLVCVGASVRLPPPELRRALGVAPIPAVEQRSEAPL